jgi:hypothetical protein
VNHGEWSSQAIGWLVRPKQEVPCLPLRPKATGSLGPLTQGEKAVPDAHVEVEDLA